MAILIMLDLVVAQKFGNSMELAGRLESRVDHASLGTLVAVLFVLRIALRLKYGAPALPAGMMTALEVKAAKWGHGLLYGLIALLIVSGLSTAVNAAYPIALFSQWDITIGQQDESTFNLIRFIHEWTSKALIILIDVHIFAALYHCLIVKDKVMQGMSKFWTRA